MSEPKRILTLRLKSKWWTRIKLGDKTEELRLATDYWRKRLVDREYDEIHIWLGYAKKTDLGRLIPRSFAANVLLPLECFMARAINWDSIL